MNPNSPDRVSSKPEISSPQKRPDSTSPQKRVIYKPFAQKLTFICKFCGGKSCKHENYLTHPGSAIKGLNSDWVTGDILAMQRPSSRIIKEFNITQEFNKIGINAIFNLQEPGEHPHCGDGIHPASGFSYFPEEFYEHGIYFFNFCWRDMTAPSTDVILKILKQMSFSLMNGNKIAIHCHAGRGRTGLIIAAWLIYHNNMTAKEAIKHVRSKRKGCIQSKSQEEILFKLDKEIRESRIIFHSAPKFKLDDYLFHQKKLLPLIKTSEVRFVPNLVILSLERLETLLNSGLCTALDIALAFYSPNDALYSKGEWSANHEKNLKAFKEKINGGSFELSEFDDPRYLAQGLLDYFDHFSVPAIQNKFIETVHAQIHDDSEKLTREMKDNFFKKLDKKEFLLVECFAKFFSKLIDADEKLIIGVRKAILRLCISLVLERKKWDKLFFKRSLIKDHSGDDKVTHLYVFMLKWIENFSHSFTENYMVANSPLKLSSRSVHERVSKSRFGTYMGRILTKGSNGFEPESPDSVNQSESPENGPSRKESPELGSGQLDTSFKQQAQQDGRINLIKNGYNHPQLITNPSSQNHKRHLSAFSATDRNESPDSSNYISQMNTGERNEVKSVTIAQSGEQSESPNRNGRHSTLSASPYQRPSIAGGLEPRRISFLNHGSNPFIADNSEGSKEPSGGSKTNVHKNYDDFFTRNALIEEETDRYRTQEDEVKIPSGSDLSNEDDFNEVVEKVEGMSFKKQTIIFEKLAQIMSSKQIKTDAL